jgi:hypothetical protein
VDSPSFLINLPKEASLKFLFLRPEIQFPLHFIGFENQSKMIQSKKYQKRMINFKEVFITSKKADYNEEKLLPIKNTQPQ